MDAPQALGSAGAVDVPRAPERASGWDSRSEELLTDAGLPGTPVWGRSIPGFGEGALRGDAGGGDGDEGDSGWDAGGRGRGGGSRGEAGEEDVAGRAWAGRVVAGKVARRGSGDPVKVLMRRHRRLCEQAVDPLEIVAGLEAHGVTDRAAARYRHRDVFALAEEMYARVPRGEDDGRRGTSGAGTDVRGESEVPPGWALFTLLPGAVCAAAVAGLGLTAGGTRPAVAVGGALAVALALRITLRTGPLRAGARPTSATRAWACWLIAYALLGDGLLRGAVAGGPDEPGDLWEPATTAVLGLALAVAPAAWCARLFAVRANARLRTSRGLDDFTASVRPLLLGVVTLFLAALGASLAAADAVADVTAAAIGTPRGTPSGTPSGAPGGASALAGTGALGALLLLARLLGVYGFRRAPALLLGTAGACEVAALVTVFAGRLPGCGAAAAPVTAAVDTWGPGVVPAAVCGAAALALLIHAARTLTLASAHAGPGDAT